MPTHPHGKVTVRACQVLADGGWQYLQQTADIRRNVVFNCQFRSFFAFQITLVELLDLLFGQMFDLIRPLKITTHSKVLFFIADYAIQRVRAAKTKANKSDKPSKNAVDAGYFSLV